jgi:hypothetical protein
VTAFGQGIDCTDDEVPPAPEKYLKSSPKVFWHVQEPLEVAAVYQGSIVSVSVPAD